MSDRVLLQTALRVLLNLHSGVTVAGSDIDLLRSSALPKERDLEIDDLADSIANRLLTPPTQ